VGVLAALESSRVRTGDLARGVGGGLRAVARIGNVGGASNVGSAVLVSVLVSVVAGWGASDFPGSNYC
jgi:hypothetical protein